MKSLVVTGASTGIGHATVAAALARGYEVFGSVRTAVDAARLRQEFPKHFTPLLFDVTDAQAVAAAAHQVAAALGSHTLTALVNNAGIAVSGPLLHLPLDQLRHQLEVNLVAVLGVTQAFAGLLGADRSRTGPPGRILNISSVAGRNGAPFVGAYAASKHALEGLSESLRRELMLHGIDVIVIGPGAIRTPIWSKADLAPYQDTPYREAIQLGYEAMMNLAAKGFPVERCAGLILDVIETPHPHTRYSLVPQPWLNHWPQRLLPKRWVDRIIASRLKLRRE